MSAHLHAFKKRVAAWLPDGMVECYLRYRWVFYMGRRFTCPYCGGRFRSMVPGGSLEPVCREKRITGMYLHDHMTCPKCGAIDRWRLLYLFLRQKTDLFEDASSVLHVSPEPGLQHALQARPQGDYLSVDLANPIAMQEMDITSMELPDASYDVVLCSHVLEHIEADHLAMAEIHRVLKPGGWALLQVPISLVLEHTFEDARVISAEEREKVFGQYDHVRIYGADYTTRLERAGFSVDQFVAREALGDEIITSYALDPDERLFMCRKSS